MAASEYSAAAIIYFILFYIVFWSLHKIGDTPEIKASDGKLYVSAIFDCYDLAVLGLAMDTNMKATLCEQTLDNAYKAYPMIQGAIIHSDRGAQYTSEFYRNAISKYGILQSMWARFKEELLYGRYDTTSMTVEQLKTLIWRYFISYWNNRRICSAKTTFFEGFYPAVNSSIRNT